MGLELCVGAFWVGEVLFSPYIQERKALFSTRAWSGALSDREAFVFLSGNGLIKWMAGAT